MTDQRQARRRLFLALYPSSAQRGQLARVVGRHCPELAAVAPAFSIRLDRLGYWPQRHMLWAMPDPMCLPSALITMVASLQQGLAGCELTLGQRPYRPHVTLARQLGRGPHSGRIDPCGLASEPFCPDGIAVVARRGALCAVAMVAVGPFLISGLAGWR